jgi:dTDP-4-amino-4,6-dideoxygalactose transaminase
MGPEIDELEHQLAAYCGVNHAISCGSGTDALMLALLAYGVGPGDAVFVPAFTFVATAEPVALFGAVPFFVDVDRNTFNLDPESLAIAVVEAREMGLKPRGVIPVDLFGLSADYDAIAAIADEQGLFVISDTAQGFGGSRDGCRAGTFGDIAATSFFPAKPLGCYGDGGAVFTDDDTLAAVMRSIRVHGQGSDKYDNVRLGINGRLDTIQAAVLIEKLAIFDDELAARAAIAQRYGNALHNHVTVPQLPAGCSSAWAQYTVLLDNRDRVAAELKGQGIPTAIYYPIPLNRQTGYRDYPTATGQAPVSEWLSERALSLPMHPYLDEATQGRICAALIDSLA